jgi:hypothetical protein
MYVTLPPRFGAAALRKQMAARRRIKAISTGDPVQDLRAEAAELGYAGDPSDLQALADFCWDAAPTDGMGALLEELASAGLIVVPW